MTTRILIILLMNLSLLWGQDTYLKIQWDPNPEPDVIWYYIYRDAGANIFVLLDSVRHPTTVYYDYTVETSQQYSYKIQAKNASGQVSGFSEVKWGIIQPTPMQITVISGDSLRIEWTTPQPYQTQLVYDTQYPPEQYTPLQSDPVTNHSVLLTNLQTEIPYYISGLALDAQGNVVATQDTSFFIKGDSVIVPVDSLPETPIIAFPNPVRQEHGGVYFDGIEAGMTVFVFNLVGEMIWSSKGTDNKRLFWNVRTTSGEMISSGIYIYVVKDKNEKKRASGKIVVLR